MNEAFQKSIFYGSAAVLGMVFAFVFLLVLQPDQSSTQASVIKTLEPPFDYFASTTIEAKAAYVYDEKDQTILYAKDMNEALPLASLTKLMTAVTALSDAATSTIVSISGQALAEDGDNGLLKDEKWTMDSLLKFTLVCSSNDGAEAIAEALNSTSFSTSTSGNFVAQMNENADRLGLASTRFFNPTGLDMDATVAGAYGSAKDVATLLNYAVTRYPDIVGVTHLPDISVTSLSNFSHTALNTDQLAGTIPGLVAGKTGYTTLAGGNLAIEADLSSGHSVVIVVLGSSYDGRFTDMQTLLGAATATISAEH